MKNQIKITSYIILFTLIFSCNKIQSDNKFYQYEQLKTSINVKSIVVDINNRECTLESVCNRKNTLIVRIKDSGTGCGECLENILEIIKSNKKIVREKTVIFLSTDNIRYFRILADKVKPFQLYAIGANAIKLPIDELGKPFFFIKVERSNSPIKYFVPERGKIGSEMTEQYLDEVAKYMSD